jgi:hypothetical protein
VSRHIYIKVSVGGGSPIDETCAEAVALANRMGIPVLFDFNDVLCAAHPGDDAALLAANWRDASFEGRKFA